MPIVRSFDILYPTSRCGWVGSVRDPIWDEENKSQDIPFKEDLDKKKKNFVENKNLARVWDSLALYDNEILRQRKNESQKLKGSRMEAFFGIIFLESGLEAVEDAVENLIKFSQKEN